MDYLYALQQLSEGPLKVLSPFFAFISEFGLQGLPVVAAIIYWCADSKKGYRLLLFMSWSSFTANIFKAIIQVPRPWLTDSRIYLDPVDPRENEGAGIAGSLVGRDADGFVDLNGP